MDDRTMTIVLGVIGADCHAVGNKILDRFFGDQGFKVVNLGVMVSQDEYIDAAIETGAEAIVVQSLYGHGEIDCQGFRERCTERGIDTGIVLDALVSGRARMVGSDPEAVTFAFRKLRIVCSPDGHSILTVYRNPSVKRRLKKRRQDEWRWRQEFMRANKF